MKVTRDNRWTRIPLVASDTGFSHVTTMSTPRRFRLHGLGVELALARDKEGRPLVLQRGSAHPQWAAIRALEAQFEALRGTLEDLCAEGRAAEVKDETAQLPLFTA